MSHCVVKDAENNMQRRRQNNETNCRE